MADVSAGASWRPCFLSWMGAVYFMAFGTYYLQHPGLLGEDGLLPARPLWEDVKKARMQQMVLHKPFELDPGIAFGWINEGLANVLGLKRSQLLELPKLQLAAPGELPNLRCFFDFPSWLWFLTHESVGLHVDQALQATALFGALLGLMAMVGIHNIFIFAFMYVGYLSLYHLGQRWLSFQWDIFLLETGALMLFYCPVFRFRTTQAAPPAAWLLRVLIAKFMYMNGVVKVTAHCPTWQHLTALEYHFASTCIPTSEAWIHHQLPPFILRMGVAVMFVAELAAPFMLLVPVLMVRRVGVVVQAALQMGIFLTGNYNWFNIQTMVLLIPAWEDDSFDDADSAALLLHRLLCWPVRAWDRFWSSYTGRFVAFLASCFFLAWSFTLMFEIKLVDGKSLHLSQVCPGGSLTSCAPGKFLQKALTTDFLMVTSKYQANDISRFSAAVLSSRAMNAFFGLLGIVCLRYVLAPLVFVLKGGCTTCLLAIASSCWRVLQCSLIFPFFVLCLLQCESLHHSTRSNLPWSSAVSPLERALGSWEVTHSYGLFRRMTGVGEVSNRFAKGFGNLPPSVVAVPAVVVEGSDDGKTWHEIDFRYTPGRPGRQPRRTAPHQPRIDWQMWFAALGNYQHNPWFVHLMYKILDGAGPNVEALLDVDVYRWQGREGPKYVRSFLYHYDFTRLDTAWARSIPTTKMINVSNPAEREEWWTRKQVGPYLEPVSLDVLEPIIKRQGWPVGAKQRKKAAQRSVSCKAAQKVAGGSLCHAVVIVRRFVDPWQQWSGVGFRSNALRSIWSGASDLFFLDSNFVLLTGPLLAVYTIKSMVVFGCSRCFARGRSFRADNDKLKTE